MSLTAQRRHLMHSRRHSCCSCFAAAQPRCCLAHQLRAAPQLDIPDAPQQVLLLPSKLNPSECCPTHQLSAALQSNITDASQQVCLLPAGSTCTHQLRRQLWPLGDAGGPHGQRQDRANPKLLNITAGQQQTRAVVQHGWLCKIPTQQQVRVLSEGIGADSNDTWQNRAT